MELRIMTEGHEEWTAADAQAMLSGQARMRLKARSDEARFGAIGVDELASFMLQRRRR